MRNILLALIGFCLPFAASAQVPPQTIAAYNAAMSDEANEGLADAAGALAKAAMAHPEDETAALLAYESAWTLCRLGNCSAAIAPAEFAVTQPATEAHPLMADREMLAAYVSWLDDPRRANRKRLDTALSAIVEAEPSMVSIHAFEARYLADLETADWRRLKESGAEAERHIQPIADLVPQNAINARLSAIIGVFSQEPSISVHRAIVELEGELYRKRRIAISEADDGEAPEWLENLYWTTSAWRSAMTAYFESSSRDRGLKGGQIKEIMASFEEGLPETDTSGPDKAKLPFCAGQLRQEPKMRYPKNQNYKGTVGAVFVRYGLDEGRPKDIAVLASVPFGAFEDEVIKTVSKWRWEKAIEQPEEPCTMSLDSGIQEIVFQIR